MTASHSSSSMFTSMRSRRMPALLTTMSTPTKAATACSTSLRAPSKSATFSPSAIASPPAASISATPCSAGDRSAPSPASDPPRSFTTTLAPARASASACARPMPRPAPVTIATLPLRSGTGRSLLEQRGCVVGKAHGLGVTAERVRAPGRVRACVDGRCRGGRLFLACKRARPSTLVVGDEHQGLVDGRKRFEVPGELRSRFTCEDGLEPDAQAAPAVDDGRRDTGPADVLCRPVMVSDDDVAAVPVALCLRGAGDLVDPLRTCGSCVEVDEDAVRRGPERPAGSREKRREVDSRADAARQPCQPDEQLRERAPGLGLVRIAALAVVAPLLERAAPAHPEWSRAGKAIAPEVLLHLLHRPEALGRRAAVHVERDAVAAADDEAEERADAHLESEALDCLRTELTPDGVAVTRAQDRILELA